jgi:hypothetical protein
MPDTYRAAFEVVVNDHVVGRFDTLEPAIREWNTHAHTASRLSKFKSGITVTEWRDRDGCMIRDGWILHVEGHRTYLNPNLTTTT